MKKSTLIPVIVIPTLGIIVGIIVIPTIVDAREESKNCDSQDIIINQTDGSVYISCIPAKGGIVTGDRNVTYVGEQNE